MSEPKTLLQMAGADLTPSRLSDAAVVLIDCQMEYVDGALALSGVDGALDEVARLLDRARAHDTPVIHVMHQGRPGSLFDLEGPNGQLADRAAAAEGEAIVTKSLPNGFAKTTLADEVAATGRRELILGGFMTHMCVSATARAALDLGYRATIVANATGTRDLPRPGGGVIDAASLHIASLAALADRFAIIADTAEALPE